MNNGVEIAVVIPAFKVVDSLKEVVLSIPKNIDHIIVVDDHCPNASGKEAEKLNLTNVTVLYHEQNQGVGGAVITGYKKAISLGCEIIVKIDGDGQMDPQYIDRLIGPLVDDKADYTKGNRFVDFNALRSMPRIRLFGNSCLSFLVKMVSGYWNIMDPTNGFTAIHQRVLEKLKLDQISQRFFFESDMLINLNIINAVVKDIDIPARYGGENSSLNIKKSLFQFPLKLGIRFFKRILFRYFIYDFNMASVYLILGLPIFILSIIFGIVEWVDSIMSGTPKSAGTIMLVALPIIISFQMLLQAVQIDIHSIPKKDR